MKSRLAIQALDNAVAMRGDVAGCIIHSDKGSQFRSRKFLRALGRYRMIGSMGGVGSSGDNAAMESFFALLQKNVLDCHCWPTRKQLRIAIVTWIERTYHRRRRQARLGRLTPIKFETIMTNNVALAARLQPVTYPCSSPEDGGPSVAGWYWQCHGRDSRGAHTGVCNRQKGSQTVKTQKTLTLDDARRIIDAGIAASERIGSPSNIAVADAGGNLIAHARMDGAQLGSIEHSIDKAHTAVLFRSATVDLAEDSRPDGQFWGMALSGSGRVLVFAGGVPIIVDGEVVGAVGVSGGSREQDSTIAQDAAAAVLKDHR